MRSTKKLRSLSPINLTPGMEIESNQLKRDVTPRNVKTLLKLSDLKPLHTH